MNYDDLRALQRKERNTQRLAEMPDDFYPGLSSLISDYRQRYNSSQNPEDIRDLDNVYKVAKDIFERREQKIFYKALRDARIDESDTTHMLDPELGFYNSVLESVRCNKTQFKEILSGNAVIAKNNEKEPEKQACESEDLNTVLLKISSEVPKFLSSDLKEIGPFKPEEVVKLQEKDAETLLSRNLAERV